MLFLKRTSELTTRFRIPNDISLRASVPYMLRKYTKDYSSSDDEKETKKSKPGKAKETTAAAEKGETETAAMKLNRLLASMKTDDPYTPAKKIEADLARPGNLSKKRRDAVKEEKANKDIFKAVKDVASMLGDEQKQKQTESELLAKLLGHSNEDEAGTADAKTASRDGKTKKPESEMSLSELIVGMKIDRNAKPTQSSRGDYVRHTLAAARNQQPRREGLTGDERRQQRTGVARPKREAESFTGSVKLFGVEPLGIFKQPKDLKDSPDMLSTWSLLHQHDLQLQVTHPPANYYEKIALWTEQGKVWRFPIDNEQDWTAEDIDVDFSEHIFLEQHLEGWCPNKGPIRHFMELVCVGLSKNPYLTAREKKDHILWYRDYFETKRDMLKDYLQQQQAAKPTKKQIKEAN